MKLFSQQQIKEWDAYTIIHEPIESFRLMERAAKACTEEIIKIIEDRHFRSSIADDHTIKIFCGTGNNGGDGLVIARELSRRNFKVETYIVRYSEHCSDDFLFFHSKMVEVKKNRIVDINSENDIPEIHPDDLIIDAIFGSGLNKPVEGLAAEVINRINNGNARVIAVDMPSGLHGDGTSITRNSPIIKANSTLTFQVPRIAFMMPENAEYIGNWEVINIHLSEEFLQNTSTMFHYLTEDSIKPMIHRRSPFSHKGNYGHALLIAGSYGKIGAAVLASMAALRVGAGLLTTNIPKCGYDILQTSIPEAMVVCDAELNMISTPIKPDNYTAIGIGPGIGMHSSTQNFLKVLIQQTTLPLILDADAINILAENKTWLAFLPKGCVFTPHPKEFERLVGKSSDNFNRMEMQRAFSIKNQCYVILKGAHTCISFPDGQLFFNSTGNPGMATAGSGDVLTGMLTGLMAQGYTAAATCMIGVFLHGLAGDIAKEKLGEEFMIARDIIEGISNGFSLLR